MSDSNDAILIELKRMNKLLALIATQGKAQNEKMILLGQLGFLPAEISELLETTANAVRVALHKARYKEKKK